MRKLEIQLNEAMQPKQILQNEARFAYEQVILSVIIRFTHVTQVKPLFHCLKEAFGRRRLQIFKFKVFVLLTMPFADDLWDRFDLVSAKFKKGLSNEHALSKLLSSLSSLEKDYSKVNRKNDASQCLIITYNYSYYY